MKRFLPLFLLLSTLAYGQAWSGILASSRAIDWSSAGATITNRTVQCGSTIAAGASAATINAAIAACTTGQFVNLAAGTFTLSAMIDFANHSNVTLRGAGANQTLLVFSGHGSCHGLSADICVGNADVNYSGGPQHTANWTAGYAKGTTSITLSSTTNLSVGNLLILDQLNDSSDTGNVWICATQNVCANDIPGGAGRTNRDQQQLVTVTGISGSTVTISPGLYMPNWRSGQSPGAWWATSTVKNDGVENLSIDNTGNGGGQGIVMFNALNSWVKGIRSITPNRNHVWIYVSAQITVRDSYFYGTQNYASQSYGVETFGSSDNLIENNIFQKVTSPLMANGSLSGTVRSYNFTINDYYDPVSASWLQPGEYFHTAGTDNVLEEGNITSGLEADQVHGTHNFITAFRNQLLGWEAAQAGAKTQQTIPVHLYTNSRYFNIIGNVLGKSGYHNHYEDVAPSGTNGETSIYTLGWSGNGGGTDGCCTNDPKVASTLMRWGNYDVVNAANRFVSGEVPSGLSLYANPVPANNTLPASFYLSAKPAWWGTMPYPAIGPDVTGGNVANVGGHVYMNPAMACYSNTMGGAVAGNSGVLAFNAASCYSSVAQTPPSAPTGLTAIVN